jgi:protein-L-isoaspartate(D-aspartate) O-methyltransferase
MIPGLMGIVACLLMTACGDINSRQPISAESGPPNGNPPAAQPQAPPSKPETVATKAPVRRPEVHQRADEREAMVKRQLAGRDIDDERVLDAMRRVPRHLFIPEKRRREAYGDFPIPIGLKQTISQPYIVAYMTQALQLQKRDRVLEIGTGSGYQAAVLGELVREVYTIEIIPELGERSEKLLGDLGYRNIHVRVGDGYKGWPDKAPFDAIIVTAAPPRLPQPLLDQLKIGGRMIIPVGNTRQELVFIQRTEDGYEQKSVLPVAFVPMTGEVQRKLPLDKPK